MIALGLADAERRPKGFRSTEFFGRDRLGRLLPDGTYAIKLLARSGDKKFEKSRKIVLDTTAPRIGRLTVVSATLADPGRVLTSKEESEEIKKKITEAGGSVEIK